MIDKCYIAPTQNKCNCNCTFCISKTRNYNKRESQLIIDDKFVSNITLLKKRGIKKFEITGGGEPFLSDNLNMITSVIKAIIPDSYIKIYTNGNILMDVTNIDELDISVVHYNSEINKMVMRPVKEIDILEKIKFFRNSNPEIKLRLSIPLIKGAIDSKEKLDEFIEITKDYVDEYVVRTLYPGTPQYENLYVDFEYFREKVVIERDNGVDNFDGLILWSDGNFYTDWSLSKRRYMYSYLLIKPDARTYINEIEDLIKENGFIVIKRMLLQDFVNQSLVLYNDKSKDYLKLVKQHLENVSYLFGNQGLVYFLDKNLNMSELCQETYLLKTIIRERYGFTNSYGGMVNKDNNLYHLNLVHAPDPEIEFYNRDLNNLCGTPDIETIDEQDFSLIRKHRSFNL